MFDCEEMTKKELIQKIVLKKNVRETGWILINLPKDCTPSDIFGVKAIDNIYEAYKDTGIVAPKLKKKKQDDEE